MSIPLDRLYQFVESIAQDIFQDRVVIYRFYPHGSKNFEDLNPICPVTWSEWTTAVHIYCNDQEPLDYEYYEQAGYESPGNLRRNQSMYDFSLLLHSEDRSNDIVKYRSGNFIPVYYWSHAMIALDWFRYAKHTALKNQSKKTFLVYNRAWAGTREYRLKFLDLLIQSDTHHHCMTWANPTEKETHYSNYQFTNNEWKPTCVLEEYFSESAADSNYSADFDLNDYNDTDIEIVLETLFDDDRLHLTEKSLRPIAVGQPFILAATHGSLEYLRRYGFQTFGDIWDETYDTIVAPGDRLRAIVQLMSKIASWDTATRANKMVQAQNIVDFNREHFFSTSFFDKIKKELVDNLSQAFDVLNDKNNYNYWIATHKIEKLKNLSSTPNPFYPTLKDVESVQDLINRRLNLQ
jgi:hypothetical protein